MSVRYGKAEDHARVQVAISEESLDEILAALCTLAFKAPNGAQRARVTVRPAGLATSLIVEANVSIAS